MNNNKIVLITGANQGIGFATVKEFLKEGFTVVLTARDEQKGLKALDEIANKNCYFCKLDVSSLQSIKNAKVFVEQKFGKLDILINNAAINYDTWQNVQNANLQEVRDTIDTNVMGVWAVTQTFLPLLKKSDKASIVNISSGAGSLNSQNGSTPSYSLSKLALNGLTLQFSNALESDNISVNSVCPGWVKTSMGGDAPKSASSAANEIVWVALEKEHSFNGKFIRAKEVISF